MICLDSDFIIASLRDDPQAVRLAIGLELEDNLATTPINYYEVLSGAMLSSNPEKRVPAAREILERLEMLHMGSKEAETISRVCAESITKGRPIPQKDLFIGGIALSANATLLTRNVRDFSKIPGLKIRTW